jgi:PAS domain-containing protein
VTERAGDLPDRTLLGLRERLRLLDTAMIATFVAVCAAASVPWFLRVLPVEIGPAARVAVVYAALHLLLSRAAEALARVRLLQTAVMGLPLFALLVLAVVWHLLGGLFNPMLLLAFVLPVVACAVVLGRGPALGAAGVSVAVVSAVALAESPELRWYLFQLGFPAGRSLPVVLPSEGASELLPGLTARPAYVFVLVSAFAVLQASCALLASSLAAARLRWADRRQAAEHGLGSPRDAFQAALHASRAPTVIVFSDTAQVLLASETFRQAMLRHGEALEGRDLFELVRFDRPDAVRDLLRTGGEQSFCRYSVGQEARTAQLAADPFQHDGAELACLRFRDQTDLFYLSAAFDGDDALLIFGPDRRVRYANRAAGELLGQLYHGMDADAALRPLNGDGADTWEGERRVEVKRQPFVAEQQIVALADGSEVLTVFRLRPEEPAQRRART